jgi:hypothetical protein
MIGVLPDLVDDITIKRNKRVNITIGDDSNDSDKIFHFQSFKDIRLAIIR